MSEGKMSDNKIRIVLFGEGGVGKSALTIRYFQRVFIDNYDPTIEDSYTKWVTANKNTRLFLQVTDTAGQEEFLAIRDHYITNGDGFLLVYAVNDKKSFEQLNSIRDHIQRIKQSKDVPIMIAANKVDLSSSDRQVTKDEGDQFALEKLGDAALHMETSAKTDANVDEVFSVLVNRTYSYLNPKKTEPQKCCVLM